MVRMDIIQIPGSRIVEIARIAIPMVLRSVAAQSGSSRPLRMTKAFAGITRLPPA